MYAEYNLEKMKSLAEKDMLIKQMVSDLTKRNGNEDHAYEVVFNSEVLNDPTMEDIYNQI